MFRFAPFVFVAMSSLATGVRAGEVDMAEFINGGGLAGVNAFIEQVAPILGSQPNAISKSF